MLIIECAILFVQFVMLIFILESPSLVAVLQGSYFTIFFFQILNLSLKSLFIFQ